MNKKKIILLSIGIILILSGGLGLLYLFYFPMQLDNYGDILGKKKAILSSDQQDILQWLVEDLKPEQTQDINAPVYCSIDLCLEVPNYVKTGTSTTFYHYLYTIDLHYQAELANGSTVEGTIFFHKDYDQDEGEVEIGDIDALIYDTYARMSFKEHGEGYCAFNLFEVPEPYMVNQLVIEFQADHEYQSRVYQVEAVLFVPFEIEEDEDKTTTDIAIMILSMVGLFVGFVLILLSGVFRRKR